MRDWSEVVEERLKSPVWKREVRTEKLESEMNHRDPILRKKSSVVRGEE